MLAGFVCLLFFFGVLAAEELTTKIVKVVNTDDTKEITILVDGKEKIIAVDKTATFHKRGKGTKEPEIADGLKGIKVGKKEGIDATVYIDMRDGKEVVTKIVLTGAAKKN
jgi:hypothetical protein